ncbi:hypothetical protein [Paractinoplanes durhamensis]|uniref:hypothetical protein n=1 Tax=Paractinoplanes durhamensis TaxID=113563 RepID=UPI00363D7CAE
MAADRSRRPAPAHWADATGIALAAGLFALVLGGTLQTFHLIAEHATPTVAPSAGTTPTKPAVTLAASTTPTKPAAGPDKCARPRPGAIPREMTSHALHLLRR